MKPIDKSGPRDCVTRYDPYVAGTRAANTAMSVIESPCTKICAIDPGTGLCVGCGGSLTEIERWISFSDDERQRIMSDLSRRMSSMRENQILPADGH